MQSHLKESEWFSVKHLIITILTILTFQREEQIKQKAVVSLEIRELLRQRLAESTLTLSRKEEMRLMDSEYSSLVDKANTNREMASWQVTNNKVGKSPYVRLIPLI